MDQDELYRMMELYSNSSYINPAQQQQSPRITPLSGNVGGVIQRIGDQAAAPSARRPSAYDEPLETRASEEYWKHLSNLPRRNKPNIWRRIGGVLTSMDPDFSPEEHEYLRDPKYAREMMDWETKQKAIQTPMIQERLENQGIRTARRYETAQDIQIQRLELARDLGEKKLAIQDMAAGDYVTLAVPGGNYWVLNRNTGEMSDSGLPTGSMNELESIKAKVREANAAELEQIKARTAGQIEVARVPRTVDQTTREVRPGQQLSPDQQRSRTFNNASKLSRYEVFRDWVIKHPITGDPIPAPPGTPSHITPFVQTPESYKAIYGFLYDDIPISDEIIKRYTTTTRGAGPAAPPSDPMQPPPPSKLPGTDPNVQPPPPTSGAKPRIRVRIKATGATGTVNEDEFDPTTMIRIQ